MRVSGYVFSVPANADISLSFATVLAENDVLSDLFALEYSDAQMRPQTWLTKSSFPIGLVNEIWPPSWLTKCGSKLGYQNVDSTLVTEMWPQT